MYKNEIDFSNEIEDLLRQKGLKYKKDVIVGSTSADYFVDYGGGSAILDLQLWKPDDLNLQLSFEMSKISTSGSGVDMVYVVMPELEEDHPENGVVSLKGVKKLINEFKEKENKFSKDASQIKSIPESQPKPKNKIFAIMPFSEKYLDTFLVAMCGAALEVEAECIRADYPEGLGDIVDKIHNDIDNSIAVIADISESRPNVLYELGYAKGRNKKIIQICSTPHDEIPFDIRNINTIKYSIGNSSLLLEKLMESLKTNLINKEH